jgi:hypothetical protein
MPALRETQTAFARGLFTGALPDNVTMPDRDEAQRRYSVYRNNVMVSLINALRSRFPVVERVVGEEFFRACAQIYIAANPPRSRLLMRYGDSFAAFLESFAPARSLPYLPDIARLEMARGEAYHAADAEPAGAELLAQAAQGDVESMRLRLQPSLRLVPSAHPIVTIWTMNQPGAKPLPITDYSGETALVARPRMAVTLEKITPAHAAFIAHFTQGGDLAGAVEAALSHDDEFDAGAHLAHIFASGLVVALA